MPDQDKILQFLAVNGPSLPTKVAKLIGTEIIIASAHLSDLSAQGKVKISNLKVGGSPLYYLPGQEDQLERFASSNINPQDLNVLNLLKEHKVLREAELELLPKVALRHLKDFAFPLQVTFQGKAELFWKWHLLPEAEANQLIKGKLLESKPKEEPLPSQQAEVQPVETETSLAEQMYNQQQAIQTTLTQAKKEEPVEKKQFSTTKEKPMEKPVEKVVEKTVEKMIEKPVERVIEKPAEMVVEKHPEKKPVRKRAPIRDEFMPLLEDFFKSKKIIIEQKEILRKNAEMNFLLKVPSVVGNLTYFCKAKNKAKCDEKDLSSAYMEAQIKKLPLLFLYTNEFTKKAQEMLDTGAFENTVVKKIKE
ncbi:hypothetical protein HZC30_07220 [Candidatus Woesearchaeota archaeon]|nr:hypothetical protein [Candidatus Woesearchaeota archaeon]